MTDEPKENLPRLAVFISGGGTGLQAIIDATLARILSAKIAWVVSSSPKAYGLERAKKAGIETFVFDRREFDSKEQAADLLLSELRERKIDFIALAGYLRLIPRKVVAAYAGKIVNIHPGPLPQYGGKGMYGLRVHQAVLEAGEKATGPTVHLVDEIYDHGRILAHASIPINENDTAESLSERVLREEHRLYPRVIQKLIKGEYEHAN